MKKIKFILTLCAVTALFLQSCRNDDEGLDSIPQLDRGEEAVVGTLEIEEYLETHFYNYEEFESPAADFDFKIRLDSIPEGNPENKIPLIQQVDFKMVQDRVDEDVMYKLYFLKVIEGDGNEVQFPDILDISFEGRFMSDEIFDSSDLSARLDLTLVINGFQDGLTEFKGGTGTFVNPDGTVDFEGFGVGAVFVPSGLGYFASPPPLDPMNPNGVQIGTYQQLVFTFQVNNVIKGDQDGDGIPSVFEDRNNNQIEEDDDFDEDFNADFRDDDDDNDGRLTINETTQNTYTLNEGDPEPVLAADEVEVYRVKDFLNNTIVITTLVMPDTDADGKPDYLDEDN